MLIHLGRAEEALASLDRAIEIEPGLALGHMYRGAALLGLGKHEAALAAYREASRLDPKRWQARYDQGILLCDVLHRYDEARREFERVVELVPGNADARFNLGNTLYGLRRFGSALQAYDRAIELRPDQAAYHGARANAS